MKVKKYYLTYLGTKREVTKSEWLQAERGAGFRSKFGDDSEATGGFTSNGMSGSIEYELPEQDRIKIRISGPSGVGKSTVGYIIAKALAEAGLSIDSYNHDIPQIIFVEENQQDYRVRAIKGVKIDLEEILTRPTNKGELKPGWEIIND